MRLLYVDNSGEFSLTGDMADNIPPYAILSHTWGDENEEISFVDMSRETRMPKAGYKKLRFCAEQAARNGLRYFWVDTCCINKENHTELSEAITSMYRWYGKAAKCYVYLSDVSVVDSNCVNPSWEPAFYNSRWFTRGWTLQELLAPPSVQFFCSQGRLLGDKASLEQQLYEITKIPIKALQGAPLDEFSVDERMGWAINRQTKREEDKVYSLLGIFNIYIPLIYGEGKENAFRRLQQELHGKSPLDRLPYAVEASFNSITKQHEPICLDNTRVDLLRDIYNWADGQDKRCIFWLNGLAGTGKSTVARTVARKLYEQHRLAASFFFSKGGGDVGHAGIFVTSIAIQLAQNVPATRQHIYEAVVERGDIASQALRDQWHHLVLRPLSKLRGRFSRTFIVIDALDECEDNDSISLIIELLAEVRSLTKIELRVFLTSRPEVSIHHGFKQLPDAEHQDFVLHNISPSTVNEDIRLYLEYNLRLIARERCLPADWPGTEAIEQLVQSASGLFIWATTACRFIREGKRFAAKRLRSMLHNSSSTAAAPEKHLDEIYTTVLKNSVYADYTDEEREEQYSTLRYVLGSVVVLCSPLSIQAISKLLHVPDDVEQTLNDLRAIVDIPTEQNRLLRIHHPSFRDFLLEKERCCDVKFWVDKEQAHKILANNCVQLMSNTLKQDICGFNAPGTLAIDAQRDWVEQHLPLEVQYACLYWVDHFVRSGTQLRDDNQAYRFLQKHFLHWLEALGWIGKVTEGLHAIASLESFANPSICSLFLRFINDAKRFALYNRLAIEQAPLQVYCSALAFAPRTSIIKTQFANGASRWMQRLPRVDEGWNAVLQSLEGHSDGIRAVAFSPDGKRLASASDDKTIKLWDTGSGAVLQTMEGHSDSVYAVAFSSDGKVLASASGDKTVMLLDTSSGAVLQTLDHPAPVFAVAFSPNGRTLASGSGDRTIELWDAGSGVVLRTLKGHSGWISAVAFSPNGKTLASASGDKLIKLWDADSGAVLQTFEGHIAPVLTVAFSPDGKTFASGSGDKTTKLWDAGSGAVLQTVEDHSGPILTVSFSPDGKTLATSSGYNKAQLKDVCSGAVLQTLEGHSGPVYTVSFSSDGKVLASGSGDKTVKLWDICTDAVTSTVEGHSGWIHAVAFSPNGKMLASASVDETIKVWDADSGAVLRTLKGHLCWVSAVVFSPDGKTLASGSGDKTVKLWDAGSGAVLQTLEGHSNYVSAILFSPDGKTLASTSNDRTVKLWGTESGAVLQTLKGHSDSVSAVAFSPDGKTLASASSDETFKLWDAGSGEVLRTFEGYTSRVNALAFSSNGKMLASASDDKTAKLWDAGSGAVLRTLESGFRALSFADDGSFLHTDRGSLEVLSSISGTLTSQQQFQIPILLKDQWVIYRTNPVLWLPPEHRPDQIAVYGGLVAFAYSSGKVVFVELVL